MGRQSRPPNFPNTDTSANPFDAATPTPGFPANPFGSTDHAAPVPFSSVGTPGAPDRDDPRSGTTVIRKPTTEEVRKRAYELFAARKGRGGTPEGDWLRAERELTAKFARQAATGHL